MPFDWNFMPSIVSAVSGLGGVWLGGHLTSKREATKEKARAKAEATYLAILVGAHLDRFVDRCISVAFDDGTYEGQPAGSDGVTHEPTEPTPTFDPLALSVEWKALPSALMYGILNLPYRVEQINRSLVSLAEYDFPDYSEFFWDRQASFAELGLEVSKLNYQLRTHAGLPPPHEIPGRRNREIILQERVEEMRRRQKEYEERVRAAEAS